MIRVEIPCEPRSLRLVRLVIRQLAEDIGFHETEAGKLEAAVSEACANVLEHACRHLAPKPPIEVVIEAGDGCIAVNILDRGQWFDFHGYSLPKFPDHWHMGHTRGAGLYLIQQCVDEVSYGRVEGDRNRLRLVKRL